MKFSILFFVSIPFLWSIASGQKSTDIMCEFSFGQNKAGKISLTNLQTDSLKFDCSISNDNFSIKGFCLTTKSDGVTKYYKDVKGASLTSTIKKDIKNFKSGSEIEFSNIWLEPKRESNITGYITRKDHLAFQIK